MVDSGPGLENVNYGLKLDIIINFVGYIFDILCLDNAGQ